MIRQPGMLICRSRLIALWNQLHELYPHAIQETEVRETPFFFEVTPNTLNSVGCLLSEAGETIYRRGYHGPQSKVELADIGSGFHTNGSLSSRNFVECLMKKVISRLMWHAAKYPFDFGIKSSSDILCEMLCAVI